MKPFAKPFIPFEAFPSIYARVWLKTDYQKCHTKNECIEFAFKCLKDAQITKIPDKQRDSYSIFNFLYQRITGKSYQSTTISNLKIED